MGKLRPRIEQLIVKEGLTDRVCLAGWRRDISAVTRGFDAFLLTSHWEGLPRVILEARAAGLPIVATRVGGGEEAIAHKCDAYPSEAGDISCLAEGLLQTLQEGVAAQFASVRQGPEFPREFHIEEMANQYGSFYERLCKQRETGSPADRSAQPRNFRDTVQAAASTGTSFSTAVGSAGGPVLPKSQNENRFVSFFDEMAPSLAVVGEDRELNFSYSQWT